MRNQSPHHDQRTSHNDLQSVGFESRESVVRKSLNITPYFDEPFYVGFNVGGFELGLNPDAAANQPGGVLSYWAVDDVEKAYSHLLALGAKNTRSRRK